MRWHHGSRVGYGEKGDIFGLEFLAERKSRLGRKRSASEVALAGD
jgi:hypothetical protein